jgi:hypothetical protein
VNADNGTIDVGDRISVALGNAAVISRAALHGRNSILAPQVSVVVADTYPNYSICSILYYASWIFHTMTVDDVSKHDLSYTQPLGTR